MSEAPLLPLIRRLIEEHGPISVATYMALALGHPRHGYYMTRDPLGARGDFTTAPEISQLFGECLAVWCALGWEAMGRPAPLALVELGPGRGTLMADLTRTLARVAPDLMRAATIHLVETSPVLRAKQQHALAGLLPPPSSRPERAPLRGSRSGGIADEHAQGASHEHGRGPSTAPSRPRGRAGSGRDDVGEASVQWHDALASVPPGPLLLIANEFFDALPVLQFIRDGGAWRERKVDWDGAQGRLAFRAGPALPGGAPRALAEAPDGSVYETSPVAAALAEEIGVRLAAAPGMALVIDYGRRATAAGDTLVAIQGGRKDADPLAAPGEADLTAHVDFAALAAAFARGGARCLGPMAQRDLLRALGIEARLAALLPRADPAQAAMLESGARRLIAPGGMGTLFLALAATSPGLPAPPGFESAARS